MKFDVYDPSTHGGNDWAEVDAATAGEAAVKLMTAIADPLDFDPEGVHPILVRRDGGDWEPVAIGIGCREDADTVFFYWEHRGRWTGRKVTPPGSTGAT